MYSVKEKLNHFRQLSNPSVAEADLALLKDKSPGNSNLIRYGLAPSKNAEDILFDLLDVVTHDEIVRNRREFLAAQEAEEETDNIPDGDDNPNPDGEKNPDDEKKNETPVIEGEKQEDETPKDDDNPADEKPTDETPAPKAEEVEQPKEETPTETTEEAEQVTVPEEDPAPEAEEVEQPKEETSTEAVEETEQPATEKKSTSPKKKSTLK